MNEEVICNQDVYKVLLRYISENANVSISIEEIKEDTKLIEDLEYDSIALIQLLVDIEDEFGINLNNDDLLADNLNTPVELWKIVQGNLNADL